MATPPRSAAERLLEPAEQAADRGARAGDDDGSGHGCLLESKDGSSRHYPAISPPQEGSRRRAVSDGHTPLSVARRWSRMRAMTARDRRSRLDLPAHLFTCIDHVGIAVPDLDEAIAFYRDTFGMERRARGDQRGAGRARGDGGRRRHVRRSCIQLLAPLDESSTIAKFLDRSGPGLQQLAYRVDRRRAGLRDPARARPPAAVRRPEARHRRLTDQLHPPQGRRRRPRRARRARRSDAHTETTPTPRATAALPTGNLSPISPPTDQGAEHVQQILDAILAGDTSQRGLRHPRAPRVLPGRDRPQGRGRHVRGPGQPATRTRASRCTSRTWRCPSSARARRWSR